MRGALVLICALALALPVAAQDLGIKPKPRPMGQVESLPIAKPLPRPVAAAPVPDAAPSPTALSVKPQPRPVVQTVPPTAAPLPIAQAAGSAPRPKPRPSLAAPAAPEPTIAKAAPTGLDRSPRPQPRPAALEQAAAQIAAAPATTPQADPAKPNLLQLLFGAGGAQKQPKGTAEDDAEENLASAAPAPAAPQSNQPRKGSVCGDRAIRGEVIGTISSKVKGCGVPDAVRVNEVAGIRLTQAVTVECGTVQALRQWIDSALRPAFGKREVVGLRIAAHYACRGRNNKRGARISEHGKGRALDISGFIFSDGTEWTISRDYNKQIRAAHKGACGIFGTTLGPGSDGYHEDHLHFDTAAYRSGPYCR